MNAVRLCVPRSRFSFVSDCGWPHSMLHVFDENFAPEKFDEWVAEELTSKLVIILFEYLDPRSIVFLAASCGKLFVRA